MINNTIIPIEAGDVLLNIRALNALRSQLVELVNILNAADFDALLANALTRDKIASIVASIRVLNSNAEAVLANAFNLSNIQGTTGVLTVGNDGKILIKPIAASNIDIQATSAGLLTAKAGVLTPTKLTLPGVVGTPCPVTTNNSGLSYTSISAPLVASLQQYIHTVPPGIIVAYTAEAVPGGWLLCDGSDIPTQHTDLIAQYPDGKLPDFRGYVVRIYDPTSSTDVDASFRVNSDGSHAGNVVGGIQYDAFPAHTHQTNISGTFNNASLTTIVTAVPPPGITPVNVNNSMIVSEAAGNTIDMGHNTAGTSAVIKESEPKDVLVTWIIKT